MLFRSFRDEPQNRALLVGERLHDARKLHLVEETGLRDPGRPPRAFVRPEDVAEGADRGRILDTAETPEDVGKARVKLVVRRVSKPTRRRRI